LPNKIKRPDRVRQHDSRALANHLTKQEVNPMSTVVGVILPIALLAVAIGTYLLLRDTTPRPPGRHRLTKPTTLPSPGRDPHDIPLVPDDAPAPDTDADGDDQDQE
jgi:hypothetical protein